MNSLNFKNAFNKETSNVGDHFQKFVFELLRKSDYPKLHKFPTAGKDGGIDLIQQLNYKRTVVECKYVGKNDISEAKNRWKEVKRHLETHLANAIPKEKQYKPWINSAKPIVSYLFCVSSEISNQNGFDEFEKDITDFFKNLSSSHPHLLHLKTIEVEIIDWNKLLQKLDNFPQLKFRWFPLAEKFGFIPIQNKSADASFRSFLEEESLPFYSRSKHLEKESNAEIQNEEQLLEMLEDTSLHGLIITGNGGAGKTRLTLELGRLAFKKDWLVFRCKEMVNADNLNKLAETISDDTKILLLMDYVETQKYFTDITEQLTILNYSYGFQIKYVANCRSSYYSTIRATPNHHQVFLTSFSAFKKPDNLWLEQYQASVVRHILEQGGIKIEEKHLTVCKNKPILAVFLLYLHQKNQGEELENLLHGADFGKWIQKRTKMSFVNVTDFELKLAKLVAMLPFSEEVCNDFDDFNSKLLGILANDGWVEKFQNNEWRSIHDVFADQIILSYTQDNLSFVEKFVRDIFSFAYSTNCLESAFITIQRVAPYFEVDFNKLLNVEIDKDLPKWKEIRNELLETSLLQEGQKLDLLSKETLWENAETDYDFQTNLGTIIRRIVEIADSLTETQQSNATSWLYKILPIISSNNFLLTWALKFSPEDMKDLALERIRRYPTAFKTKNLFSAWLESKLPSSDIGEYLSSWLEKHQQFIEASFIFKDWLDAKGSIELITKPIQRWLTYYAETREAVFVYTSWLDVGAEVRFVKEFIRRWLKRHGRTLKAVFIYKSWLNATDDSDFVKEFIGHWLKRHQTSIEAGLVYSQWLDANGSIDLVKKPIRLWLARYHLTLHARFVYESWLNSKGDSDFVKEFIRLWLAKHQTILKARYVYSSWLGANGEPDFVKNSLKKWLDIHQMAHDAQFIYKSWLVATSEKEFVKDSIKKWLEIHQISLVAQFVYKSWLDAKGEKEFVREHIRIWLEIHQMTSEARFVYKSWLDAKGEKEFVREHIRIWLEVNQTTVDAQFVYKSWLDAKGEKEFVREHIRIWLEVNQTTVDAQFVYKSWLDAKGEKEFVRELIKKWLNKHQTHLVADHVIGAWLKAKGETEFIKEHLKEWLEIHRTKLDACFVLGAWLMANGEIEFVKEHLIKWLEIHRTCHKSHFVYSSWLKANGEKEIVRESLTLWLAEHQSRYETVPICKSWLVAGGETEFVRKTYSVRLAERRTDLESHSIFKSWLDANGEIDFVKDDIRAWLNEHRTDPKAGYIFKSWLDAKGEIDFVKDDIRVWLNKNQTNPKADFVIGAWLDANGEIDFVKEPLKEWLIKHKSKFDVSFVCSAWLDANGDFDFIREFALDYLAKYYDKKDAGHLAKRLAKQPDLPIETIRYILLWCSTFGEDEDAILTIASFKNEIFDSTISNEFLVATERVIESLLLKTSLENETKEQIITIFSNLFSNTNLQNSISLEQIEQMYLKWIKYHDSFGENQITFSVAQKPVCLERFATLLEKNLLDIQSDRLSIERFLHHLNNWYSENRQTLQPIIRDLQSKYRSDIWEIVNW